MDADTEENVSKAEELAHRIIPIMDENGSWPRMAYREDIMMLLEQYGRLVQESAAKICADKGGETDTPWNNAAAHCTRDILRMPLP